MKTALWMLLRRLQHRHGADAGDGGINAAWQMHTALGSGDDRRGVMWRLEMTVMPAWHLHTALLAPELLDGMV